MVMVILNSIGMGECASDTHHGEPGIHEYGKPEDRTMAVCLLEAFHVLSIPIRQSLLPYHFHTRCTYTRTRVRCLLMLAHRCNNLDIL